MLKLLLKRSPLFIYLILVGICFINPAILPVKPAYACSGPTRPADWKPPTLKERVDMATVVLEGAVIQIDNASSTGNSPVLNIDVATVEVAQYLKGSGPAFVKITGFGPATACRTPINQGEKVIFFTWGSPSTGLEVGYWWQTRLPGSFFGYEVKESVSPDLISEILQASGQTPFIPGQPTTPNTPVITSNAISPNSLTASPALAEAKNPVIASDNDSRGLLAGLILAGVIVIGVVLVLVFRRQKNILG